MIYDCVILFNELDLLELRFSELESVVDRFVIVEAPVTFSGRQKRLAFAENRERFRRWQDRIIHVVVDDMPRNNDPWARERHQRNAIMRGLALAQSGDGIMVSDVDEIPCPASVKNWSPNQGLRRFHQLFCYYWMNCVGGMWTGTRIVPRGEIARYGDLEAIRRIECPLLEPGGWHFSYLGGAEQIVSKLEAYSHQDLNQDRFKERRRLACAANLGIDLFERQMRFHFCPLDGRFPRQVRKHRAKYDRWIRDAAFHEEWYPDEQLLRIFHLAEEVRPLSGALMDIGCWEGKSTIALAHGCDPETLIAVDTWEGNRDEHPDHETVRLARQRDVYGQFAANVRALTNGNVQPMRCDCHDFLQRWRGPIKFAHIDASHDYASVHLAIEALLRWVVPGGLLCGNDFQTASANRADLAGGVERAVREALPGFEQFHNLWLWRRPLEGGANLPGH